MKEIVLNDYYTKLTKSQKKKHAEKKGMICYYEWYDTLVEECTPEEVGYIFLALLYYDLYGGAKELPAFLAEKINSDRALKLTFLIFMDKIAAASKEWINRHKLSSKNKDTEADETSEEDDSSIDEAQDTNSENTSLLEELPF